MKVVRVEESYRHFVTGEFKSHAEFLPDEIYSKVLDNIVITCVDIIVCHAGKMLLGKRAIEPQSDWWIIRGKMKPGESFNEAATRNVRRELGLNIKPYLFQYLSSTSLVWVSSALLAF